MTEVGSDFDRGPTDDRTPAHEPRSGDIGQASRDPRGLEHLAGMLGNRQFAAALSRARNTSPPWIQPAGNATATAFLSRVDQPPEAPVTVAIGDIKASKFSEVLATEKYLAISLEQDIQDIPAGVEARTNAEELIKEARDTEGYLESKGDAPLDQTVADQVRLWYDAFVQSGNDVIGYYKQLTHDSAQAQEQTGTQAASRLDQIEDDLAEARRAAFLKKDESTLTQILNAVKSAKGIATAIWGAIAKTRELEAQVDALKVTPGTTYVSRWKWLWEKWQGPIDDLKSIATDFTLLYSALKFMNPSGATDLDKEADQVKTGWGVVSTATGITKLAGGELLYFNAIMAAGAKALDAAVAIMSLEGHRDNKVLLASGKPEDLALVDWDVEPGGRAMYDFMVTVMRAGSAEQIPHPIPASISKFLGESSNLMSKGSGAQLPTTGFWIWKQADQSKAPKWLFENRTAVWSMLYGEVPAPA